MIITVEQSLEKKRNLFFDSKFLVSLRKVLAIARSTFRESIREKIWLLVFLFGAIVMASSYFLSPLAVGARGKIILDVGLASISIIGVIASVLVGSTLLYKEIDKKAIYLVLTRPVTRFEYLLGKLSGIVSTIGLLMFAMALAFVAIIYVSGLSANRVLLAAIYLSILEMTLMSAIVVFFSTFTTPILTSFFSFCIFVAGSLSGDLRAFAQRFGGSSVRWLMDLFYYTLPNFSVFNLRHEAVHNLPFNMSDLTMATVYAAVYSVALIYFGYIVFKSREMR